MVSTIDGPINAIASLFGRRFDPARARKLPVTNDVGQSNVRGLYLVGEIAGTPLIKLGLNCGRAVIDHIARVDLRLDRAGSVGRPPDGWDPAEPREEHWIDLLIAGCRRRRRLKTSAG